MTKTIFMSSRRRNLSESDARNSEDESDHLKNSPSLEGANFVNFNYPLSLIEYFVSLPDDRVICVEVDSRATGNEVLLKVCNHLGITQEKEYFGLMYRGKSNEWLWLNLRNRLNRQVVQTSPCRLDFRVKYFVQPHMIIDDECRHQFFLHAKNQVIEGCWIYGVPDSDLNHVIALLAQSEFGSFKDNSQQATQFSMKYAKFWPRAREEEIQPDHYREIARFHQQMSNFTKTKAEYEALRLMADNWVMYGVAFYTVKDCYQKEWCLGVGPEGLYICTAKNYQLVQKYGFEAVQEVNCGDRNIELRLLQDDARCKYEKYNIETTKLAKSFQRFVFEMNQFFTHETVPPDIADMTKCTNSLFLFKRNSSVKSYQYDITKTSREVYDSAKRRVHSHIQIDVNGTTDSASRSGSEHNKTESTNEEVVRDLRREVENLRDLVQCIVCRDLKINRVFIPCMHIVCCDQCASRVSTCPVCRVPIRMSHHAFPKWIDEASCGHKTIPLNPIKEHEELKTTSPTEIDKYFLPQCYDDNNLIGASPSNDNSSCTSDLFRQESLEYNEVFERDSSLDTDSNRPIPTVSSNKSLTTVPSNKSLTTLPSNKSLVSDTNNKSITTEPAGNKSSIMLSSNQASRPTVPTSLDLNKDPPSTTKSVNFKDADTSNSPYY